MSSSPEEFTRYRQKMNERILSENNKVVRRFFSLDKQVYAETEHLSSQTKELLGLVASLVLRCDDCISYHVAQAKESGSSNEQIIEAMSVGLVVGGSIVIPHMRRAVGFLDQLDLDQQGEQGQPAASGCADHPAAKD